MQTELRAQIDSNRSDSSIGGCNENREDKKKLCERFNTNLFDACGEVPWASFFIHKRNINMTTFMHWISIFFSI